MDRINHDTNEVVGIITDRIETIHNIARNYIRAVGKIKFSELVQHIMFTSEFCGECKASECLSGIMRIRDDKDITIYGHIFPPSPAINDVIIEYDIDILQVEKDGRDNSLPAYIEAVKYLRSKFPNMVIDLEPKYVDSNTACSAPNLIITNKKCPICGELMYVDSNTTASIEFSLICKICKHHEIYRDDGSITIGSGTSCKKV